MPSSARGESPHVDRERGRVDRHVLGARAAVQLGRAPGPRPPAAASASASPSGSASEPSRRPRPPRPARPRGAGGAHMMVTRRRFAPAPAMRAMTETLRIVRLSRARAAAAAAAAARRRARRARRPSAALRIVLVVRRGRRRERVVRKVRERELEGVGHVERRDVLRRGGHFQNNDRAGRARGQRGLRGGEAVRAEPRAPRTGRAALKWGPTNLKLFGNWCDTIIMTETEDPFEGRLVSNCFLEWKDEEESRELEFGRPGRFGVDTRGAATVDASGQTLTPEQEAVLAAATMPSPTPEISANGKQHGAMSNVVQDFPAGRFLMSALAWLALCYHIYLANLGCCAETSFAWTSGTNGGFCTCAGQGVECDGASASWVHNECCMHGSCLKPLNETCESVYHTELQREKCGRHRALARAPSSTRRSSNCRRALPNHARAACRK